MLSAPTAFARAHWWPTPVITMVRIIIIIIIVICYRPKLTDLPPDWARLAYATQWPAGGARAPAFGGALLLPFRR